MCPVTVVVSLGTGIIPTKSLKSVDIYKPESLWESAKMVMGIPSLANLLVDQVRLQYGTYVL